MNKDNIESISFVVACFNEMHNINDTLDEIIKALTDLKIEKYEIIVVDDASTDNSQKIIKDRIKKDDKIKIVVNEKNLGYGGAVQKGFQRATLNHIMNIAGDNCHPNPEIKKMLNVSNKYDLILSYYTNKDMRPFFRKFFTSTYTPFLNFIFGLDLIYYNGMAIYKKSTLENIRFKSNSFTWQIGLIVQVYKNDNLQVKMVPTLLNERNLGNSKAFSIKNSINVIYSIFKIFLWNLKN